jgi:multiple sugar transport system substrate-binding protein
MIAMAGLRGALAALIVGASVCAFAGALNVQLGYASAAERDALKTIFDEFHAANPDVDIHLALLDRVAYRESLPAALSGDAAPDVFNGFAGEQMRELALRGQLDDLSDLWKANNWWTAYSSTAGLATVAGRQVALPYDIAPWGLFTRRDVLEGAGLKQAPRDLSALLTACSKLRKAGYVPIALGGRDGWPVAAWFDFMDVRTNGYDFHQQLVGGKASYDDGNVRRTFMMWKQLVEAQCFAPDASTTTEAAAEALFAQGRAAMLLQSTSLAAVLPEAARALTEFNRFPLIDSSQAEAEVAPVGTWQVAARARNKADARRFLKFVAAASNDGRLAKALGTQPANNNASVQPTVLVMAAYKTLEAAHANVVLGYDHDTPSPMARAGMAGFLEFLARPSQMYPIIGRLDAVKATAYTTTVSQDTVATAKTRKP